MRKIIKKIDGLTLIELLAVIAIIAILFILLIPSINSAFEKSRISGVQTDFRSYQIGLKGYFAEFEGKTHKEENINPFLDKNLQFTDGESKSKSPWNTPYKLQIDGNDVSIYTTNNDEENKLFSINFKKENGNYVSEQIGFDKKVSLIEYEEQQQQQTVYKDTLCGSRAIQENPASDFVLISSAEGVIIETYIGTSLDIVIPCEINGQPVVAIRDTSSTEMKGFRQKNIKTVVFPNTMKRIGRASFSENSLTSVVIPNSVTTIGDWAFNNNLLTSVTFGKSLTSIGNSAFQTNGISSIILPNSLTSIGSQTFFSNYITSVIVPNSVTSIGSSAFKYNDLTSVTIGKSVNFIGDEVFYHNSDLKTVTDKSNMNVEPYFNSSPTITKQ